MAEFDCDSTVATCLLAGLTKQVPSLTTGSPKAGLGHDTYRKTQVSRDGGSWVLDVKVMPEAFAIRVHNPFGSELHKVGWDGHADFHARFKKALSLYENYVAADERRFIRDRT